MHVLLASACALETRWGTRMNPLLLAILLVVYVNCGIGFGAQSHPGALTWRIAVIWAMTLACLAHTFVSGNRRTWLNTEQQAFLKDHTSNAQAVLVRLLSARLALTYMSFAAAITVADADVPWVAGVWLHGGTYVITCDPFFGWLASFAGTLSLLILAQLAVLAWLAGDQRQTWIECSRIQHGKANRFPISSYSLAAVAVASFILLVLCMGSYLCIDGDGIRMRHSIACHEVFQPWRNVMAVIRNGDRPAHRYTIVFGEGERWTSPDSRMVGVYLDRAMLYASRRIK